MTRKKGYVRNFAVALVLTGCLLVLPGCGKSGNESDGKAAKIEKLSRQIAPLKVCKADENIETITLNQAMAWHESHEHDHDHEHNAAETDSASAQEETHASHAPHHLCLGVSTGYQAIRFAAGELFPEGVANASDFDIKVSGPMDGVWDVMSLYTGRELEFDGKLKEMGLKSFTFTARRISQDKSIVFCLRSGMIPEEFFALKNQGATCGHQELGIVKRQALLNVLSAEPKDCFQIINANK
ncbi:MAG: hypothetical protein K8R02_08585 [Anaerohalosphaeraceae bacterium]|nr:hypothetical protein [Anaerohalosphaeraceae bacterium]